MRAWVNGSLLDDVTGPALSVLDHGLTVGDGVFEAIKVVRGEPFALTRHLRRMTRSAAAMGLPEPDHDRVRSAVAAVLAGSQPPLSRLRVTYTAGAGPMASGRWDEPPSLVVVWDEVEPAPATTYAVPAPWPRNERGLLAGVKTTSYAENVVALAYAHQRGASETVFANIAGHVCEGTGSNVFYVVDGRLCTPTLASGCLAGITRELLLEWLEVTEVDEPFAALEQAEEIMLTSSFRDVQAVARFGDRKLAAPGPVTEQAMAQWTVHEQADLDP